MKRRTFDVSKAEAGERLDGFLQPRLKLSVEAARALVLAGAVYRRGRRCQDPSTPLSAGDLITAVLEEGGQGALEPRPERAQAIPSVLYEDAQVLAVSKPAGMTAQPTPGHVGDSLVDWASERLGHPAGLVHRLDRETSGVTVFGKTKEATSALAAAFREGAARKRYLAAVSPALRVERGEVDLPLSKDPSRPGRYRASREAQGVPALTEFQRLVGHPQAVGLPKGTSVSMLALFPRTGRTHQLRAHLAALGSPIVGDVKYGGTKAVAGLTAARCLLHAQGLSLPHPLGERPLLLEAPVPEDLLAFFVALGVSVPLGAWPAVE